MALLTVLKYPDSALQLKADEVLSFDECLKQIVNDMFETMYENDGVGLAAIQVNIQKRIFVMDVSEKRDEPICLINPTIIKQEGCVLAEEGCLSYPGIYAKVKRAETITTRFFDVEGNAHEKTSTGLESRCIQHELDHLDGVSYVDHLSKLKRKLLLKKIEKMERVS